MRPRISIRRKILLTFALFFILSLLVTAFGYYRYHVLNQKIHLVENKDTLLNSILEARRYEKNFFITLDTKHLQDAVSYVQKSETSLAQLIENYGHYAQTRDLPEQLQDLKTYKYSLNSLIEFTRTHPPHKKNLRQTPAFSQRQAQITKIGRRVTQAVEGGLQQERHQVKRLIRESRLYLVIFLGFIMLIACVTFLFLIINVNRPLKNIEEAILKIIHGDYSNIPNIRSGDEFERLVESLNTMLDELNKRSEQLIQSEKMVALGTLTSGVAHELNNPLNNISTSLQIILEELGDEDIEYQRQLITESEGEVIRAQDIVKALLEFSRETQFTLAQENFQNLVYNTLKLIQGEIPTNVQVKVQVPENIECHIDARRVQQVLLNLSLNAIQAMEGRGGTLTIEAEKDESGHGFSFFIQDTGTGIDSTEQSKIFDPFYTTKDVGKGSGLGLSVTKGIVESHGGRISVHSQHGQGTRFTVYLPFAGSSQENPEHTPSSS